MEDLAVDSSELTDFVINLLKEMETHFESLSAAKRREAITQMIADLSRLGYALRYPVKPLENRG